MEQFCDITPETREAAGQEHTHTWWVMGSAMFEWQPVMGSGLTDIQLSGGLTGNFLLTSWEHAAAKSENEESS